MRLLTFIVLCTLATAAAGQQPKPIVRAVVTPETVMVGEAAELTITILVPTWFTRPPQYPSLELANAITREPANNSYPLRERVGNESWSGIVRSYDIYPLLGANYRLAGQTVSISFANPGGEPIRAEVELPEVTLRGVVPQGAETLQPYIAGRRLDLNIEVDGATESLQAGDAVVLTYSAELEGLPAIFIPPLAPALQFDGVSVYPEEPKVVDGDSARRSEKVTLVFAAGGEFTVPDVQLDFWNTDSNDIEQASAAGKTFIVAGPPAAAADQSLQESSQWRRAALFAGLAIILLLAMRALGPRLADALRNALMRRRQSEEYAYRRLQQALRSRQEARTYESLLAWLQRLSAGYDTRSFTDAFGNDGLREAIDKLSACRFRPASQAVDWAALRKGIGAARKQYLDSTSNRQASSLPPLNP